MAKVQQVQTPPEEGGVVEKPRKGATGRGLKRVREPNKPSKFAVVLHNDDYTPMDFVVFVLQEVFNHPFERAEHIMLSVHKEGLGVAGIYNLEIAETKAFETAEFAKEHQYPLKITIEEIAK